LNGSFSHLAEVGSTNDWLLAQAAGLPDGHWVIADRQTAGRGRRGRVWRDGAGNLMASVLVRASGPLQQLSFVAALALRDALDDLIYDAALDPGPGFLSAVESRTPDQVRDDSHGARHFSLKWPNDVLLNGIKISGILLESAGDALVIGFGVNITSHPAGTERPATSLAAAGLAIPAPVDLLARLMPAFAQWRALWAAQGFEPIRAAWLQHAAGVGDRIAARLGAETLEGRFEGLAADGALALRLDDGSLRPIHAGEVFAL
jgi:BirA family transcriptional regulator, biotin operon repressor / biotin---[acetyl-CoA-carboxylase] ligase